MLHDVNSQGMVDRDEVDEQQRDRETNLESGSELAPATSSSPEIDVGWTAGPAFSQASSLFAFCSRTFMTSASKFWNWALLHLTTSSIPSKLRSLGSKLNPKSLLGHYRAAKHSKRRLTLRHLLFLLLLMVFTGSILSKVQTLVSHSKSGAANVRSPGRRSVGYHEIDVDIIPRGNSKEAENCSRAALKVFVYDMPVPFNFGLLNRTLEPSDWAAVAFGGRRNLEMLSEASQVPRFPYEADIRVQYSMEHYLLADILTPQEDRDKGSRAVRVLDPEEADVFFVPFYASRLYENFWKRNETFILKTEQWLVDFLRNSTYWQRSGGSDHVICASHPNALRTIRGNISNAIQIVVDYWRFPPSVSNITKDVVMPYHHVLPPFSADSELQRLSQGLPSGSESSSGSSWWWWWWWRRQQQRQQQEEATVWSKRDILLFFRGGLVKKDEGRDRMQLFELLRNEPGVSISEAVPSRQNIRQTVSEISRSKFCLHIAGDTPSSCRFFDAAASGCVPVVISDHLELPFESSIDYSKVAIFVSSEDALRKGYLIQRLRSMTEQSWTAKWQRLHAIWRHFEYQHPAKAQDAINMVWQEVKFRRCRYFGNLHENRRRRLRAANLI